METQITSQSHRMLFLNTLAFTVCFAVWMFNGVLVTFLVNKGVFNWGPVQIGWLLAIPVLTGAIFRLHFGIYADKFGGKWIAVLLLLICAISMYLLSYANSFWHFVLLGFGYGMAGNMFSLGIAYTSVWYPKEWQGRALGIFGMGNAGAALTTLLAPTLLNKLTDNGANIEGWRSLPKVYAAALVIMAIIFILFAINKKSAGSTRTVMQMMQPLKEIRVWRFGLYYFLVFGCFVAFSQWLVPYFVNMYAVSLVVAGLFASLFSLPSGVIRALGGWMSDKWGARKVMRAVFLWSAIISALLLFPKMEIFTSGKGVLAAKDGKVIFVSDTLIKTDTKEYPVKKKISVAQENEKKEAVFPQKESWQVPVVKEGEQVKKKQLLAKGITKIKFDANMWVAGILALLIGSVWGIGKAAVYRYIPDYFPKDVGAVGGLVGLVGALGGFVCPVIFGYLLEWTGLWTSCWMLMLLLSLICYFWLQQVVRKIVQQKAPEIAEEMEHRNGKQ